MLSTFTQIKYVGIKGKPKVLMDPQKCEECFQNHFNSSKLFKWFKTLFIVTKKLPKDFPWLCDGEKSDGEIYVRSLFWENTVGQICEILHEAEVD